MAVKQYQMVRLKRSTHGCLVELRDRFFALYQDGKFDLPDSEAEHLSLDHVITILMERDEEHRRRARRQRNKTCIQT